MTGSHQGYEWNDHSIIQWLLRKSSGKKSRKKEQFQSIAPGKYI